MYIISLKSYLEVAPMWWKHSGNFWRKDFMISLPSLKGDWIQPMKLCTIVTMATITKSRLLTTT